ALFHGEDGLRAFHVTGVQTCALPIYPRTVRRGRAQGQLACTVPAQASIVGFPLMLQMRIPVPQGLSRIVVPVTVRFCRVTFDDGVCSFVRCAMRTSPPPLTVPPTAPMRVW